MDAYLSNRQNSRNFFEPPPVLIAADNADAAARARATVAAMPELRIADTIEFAEFEDRLARQGAASALWIELDCNAGSAMDSLLDCIAREISHGRYPAVIAAPANLIDRIGPHALDLGIDLLVDADEAQRTAALAVAVAKAVRFESVSEATADKNAARLRQLSEEVSRIASTLARLSAGPTATPRPVESVPAGDVPPVSAETVRSVIRARRLRTRFFSEDLFADPAWDMLLDLLQAEISQLRVPVSSLCIAAAVPATTALRWLKTLVQEGIFVRRADPHDGRRVFVELAPECSRALRRYFAEVTQVPVI
jgi:DNA-binding MarR family transcriptional regulator